MKYYQMWMQDAIEMRQLVGIEQEASGKELSWFSIYISLERGLASLWTLDPAGEGNLVEALSRLGVKYETTNDEAIKPGLEELLK